MVISELKKYKRIIILGYGIEGKATEIFLKKYHKKASLIIADEKDDSPYLSLQKQADLAIRTPHLHPKYITIPYTTATNIFFANITGKTIGITGTKGKSTTSTLLYDALCSAGKNVKLVGNIGRAMLSEYDSLPSTIFVVELSSYQLCDLMYSPDISCILNIYQAHLDFHEGMDKYISAKERIVKFARKDNIFIYNPRFSYLSSIDTKAQKKPFCNFQIQYNTKLLGYHNKENINAAYTIYSQICKDNNLFAKALTNFKPLPHRLTEIGIYKTIRFIDDAAAVEPDAAIQAIKTIKNIDTIILGGLDRNYDFKKLIQTALSYKIRNYILFPNTQNKMFKLLKDKPSVKIRIKLASNMQEAVLLAYSLTPKNGVCLLSCGAPSYSLFENFDQKGKLFTQYVKSYAKKNKTKKEI